MRDRKLVIENFAGIKSAELEVNDITILIGPQASGKSVIAKLVYFFEDFWNVSTLLRPELRSDKFSGSNKPWTGDFKKRFETAKINIFKSFFPPESWTEKFSIEYRRTNTLFRVFKLKRSPDLNIEIEGGEDDLENLHKIVQIREEYSKLKWEQKSLYSRIYQKKKLLHELSNMPRERQVLEHILQLQNEIQEIEEKLKRLEERYKRLSIDEVVYHELLVLYQEKNIFIPASRSFFALLKESFFKLLEADVTIDPFVINFGKHWENAKALFQTEKFSDLFKRFVKAKYIYERETEFLLHNDLRKVPLFMASSGQQELLPVLMVLKYLEVTQEITASTNFVFFEEPETHLFPETQKHLVEFISEVFNSNPGLKFFITTHSPYILTSFNNLIYAAYISSKSGQNEAKLGKLKNVIPQNRWIPPDRISTYAIDPRKGAYRIQEKETGLISQTIIDDISDKISMEFEELLSIEFDDER